MYISFKYATCVNFGGGVSERRLRGYEVDQLYDHLGKNQVYEKEEELKKLRKQLEDAITKVKDTVKANDKLK